MSIKASLMGIALATAATSAYAEETSLDVALMVGDDGQAVHAEPFHDATFDGGILKIVDDETTVNATDRPQTNAVTFECFDPDQPDRAVEELADKFIRYAEGTSIEERLAEFDLLQTYAADWHRDLCLDS
ncbi:MAG: hypothetical protein AB8B83_00330 [Bdellovibrionales bacterium]